MKQNKVSEDHYNNQYSYDDCILNHIKEKNTNKNITQFLTTETKRKNGIEEIFFKFLSEQLEQLESGMESNNCKIPSTNLRATFDLASLDFSLSKAFATNYYGFINETVHEERIFGISIDFPRSFVLKEVTVLTYF